MKHRLIGDGFPIKELSLESAKEKHTKQHGITTLHTWWARRPLTSSRATIYAALADPPKKIDEWGAKNNFLLKLSKLENLSDQNILQDAKKEILEKFKGKPKVLDPFSGGGSIPFEALRLGCETFAVDYNPVAVLVLKCLLEFPNLQNNNDEKNILKNKDNKLIDTLKKYGEELLKRTKKDLDYFYKTDDDEVPICYMWSRTIPCQNPTCGAEIPLLRQFWIVNTTRKKISLYPNVVNKKLEFQLVGDGFDPIPDGFDPSIGTVKRAIAHCHVCKSTTTDKITRELFQKKLSGERLIAIAVSKNSKSGKHYRLANENDIKKYNQSSEKLSEMIPQFREKWGIEPIPDEKIKRVPFSFGVINVWVYGFETWGALFNNRQKLLMIYLINNLREIKNDILKETKNEEFVKIIMTILSLLIDKIAASSNMFCRWVNNRETIADIFSRQAIPMVWDYPETNILNGKSRSFKNLFSDVLSVIELATVGNKGNVKHGSATNLPFENDFFDAVITDPPYYDNVPYSYLSDFFYVWLKRSVGKFYPDLFITNLSIKSDEVVAYNKQDGKEINPKIEFENKLKKSFEEINRVLKPDGIAVIVYAHKSTLGWESIINSILDSGLIITAAWPLHTEMKGRLRAHESAVLASSIYMVGRKWDKEKLGFYRDVKKDLEKHIRKKLEHLWNQGILGADFFISAIGSSIEIFGKYEKIVDDNDQQITTMRLLDDVRKIVTDFAIHQVLQNGFGGEISQMSRLYILWRWAYGDAKVPFDDALKMTQSVGVDIEHEWNRGFFKKESEFIRVLGPTERKMDDLNSAEMIDVLHKSVMFWKNNERKEMAKILKESGFGNSDVFFKVAQAISESNPGSSESKLLDGFLTSKSKIMENIGSDSNQTKLD